MMTNETGLYFADVQQRLENQGGETLMLNGRAVKRVGLDKWSVDGCEAVPLGVAVTKLTADFV